MRAEVVMVFVVVFFVVMLATFVLPGLPPGGMIVRFLGISLQDSTGSGIPTTILVVGFLNGLIYGTAALLIYSLARWLPVALYRDKNQ